MVYPVGNPYAQQIPAANTFQPGGTESVKKPEENKIQDATRPAGTETARAEKSSNRNTESNTRVAEDDRSQDTGAVYSSANRGTNLNITV